MPLSSDESYIRLAIKVGALGLGYTSPNPAVGAVIVDPKTGEVIAKGYHRGYGLPHAEVEALAEAKDRAKGCYLYVTLEPCCHHGKTPPCTEGILQAGIKGVICGLRDPNPIACGGLEILKNNGVEVKVGVCAKEAAYLTRFHLSRILRKRPWVMMKVASTLDGKIATSAGDSKWITGPEARKFAHKLRAIADAILVGRGTVEKDDPELTVRLVRGKNPIRLILDTNLNLSLSHKVFHIDERKRTVVFCDERADPEKEEFLKRRGIEVVRVPGEGSGGLNLMAILNFCQEKGISSILVEGGGKVHGSFLEAKLYDEVFFCFGPLIMGDQAGVQAVSGKPLENLKDSVKIQDIKVKRLGDSVLIHGLTEIGQSLINQATSF